MYGNKCPCPLFDLFDLIVIKEASKNANFDLYELLLFHVIIIVEYMNFIMGVIALNVMVTVLFYFAILLLLDSYLIDDFRE